MCHSIVSFFCSGGEQREKESLLNQEAQLVNACINETLPEREAQEHGCSTTTYLCT